MKIINASIKYHAFLLLVVFLFFQILTSCSLRSERNIFFDSFDEIDQKNWHINESTFPDCGSTMKKESVTFKNSMLVLTVDHNHSPKDNRKYRGGEIASTSFLNYGTFTVRMKNNITTGTVSSFFLMNAWKPANWKHKEIDIEFLGKDPTKVQFTVHRQDSGKSHVEYNKLYDLGFDSSKDFNEYGIRWTKDSINWLINGVVAHTETRVVPDTLMQIRMNHWTANDQVPWTTKWLGEVNNSAIPSKVFYDWIRYEPLD